jgi:hydrogenase nickel incorporation protein HypA/HybF
MHEVGIVQSILEIAAQQTKAAEATQVHTIRLRIGRLTGVVPEAIEHAFAVLRAGTPAAEAVLAIEIVPAICWCDECEQEFTADGLYSECPTCGTPSLIVRQGQEMDLVSLEVS